MPAWFPSEEPDRDRVDLLSELCAAGAGIVSLDAARELDLLRERVAELLRTGCILALPRPAAARPGGAQAARGAAAGAAVAEAPDIVHALVGVIQVDFAANHAVERDSSGTSPPRVAEHPAGNGSIAGLLRPRRACPARRGAARAPAAHRDRVRAAARPRHGRRRHARMDVHGQRVARVGRRLHALDDEQRAAAERRRLLRSADDRVGGERRRHRLGRRGHDDAPRVRGARRAGRHGLLDARGHLVPRGPGRDDRGARRVPELAPFATRALTRKRDGVGLTYWNPNTTTCTNTRLAPRERRQAAGRCGSWAEFFIDMLKVHGITSADKVVVVVTVAAWTPDPQGSS